MVRRQLCTLDDLMDSGFGRPFPRHGLQLLFWFSNHCVTCELINFVLFIKLVSECQPENGSFGFHHFSNNESLLPVLTRRLNPERQVVYSEVGNLNTNTFQAAASLPEYVRENYEIAGNNGNKNTDRVIISFHMQTRIVETVHVTKHDEGFPGRFSPHGTYKVSCELIQALQNPELDITTFLNHMGYYTDIQSQQLYNDMVPLTTNYYHYYQPMQYYNEGHDIWRSSALGRSNWRQLFKDLDGGTEPRNYASGGIGGGGEGIFKVLLTAGALYLAAKCFSWLWNCWTGGSDENIIKMVGWSTPRYQPSHVMLDYVY